MDKREKRDFRQLSGFKKAMGDLGLSPSYKVSLLQKLSLFQRSWNMLEEDIPDGFHLKELDKKSGSYKLLQIDVTRDYRATVIMINKVDKAFWVLIFKKTKDKNADKVDLAKKRAKDFWQSDTWKEVE